MNTNSNSQANDNDTKEALSLLIQLVNIAQKKGAYDLHESYLAFNAISKFVDDPKLESAKLMINKAFNKAESDKQKNVCENK